MYIIMIKWVLIFLLSYALCLDIHSWIEPVQEGGGVVRLLADLATTIKIVLLIYWLKQK